MKTEINLSPKRARFVEEYLIDFNGTQAAIRAGYSPKTADRQANQLLRKLEVQQAVEAGRKKKAEECGITQEYVINNLKEIVERGLQRTTIKDKKGDDILQYNPKEANKALELLGKHLGLFTDKIESSNETSVVFGWKE